MAVYVTLKCDGMMPPGSKDRCRAGFSVQAEIHDHPWGGDMTSVTDAINAARQHGWSDEFVAFESSRQYCPSCTRHNDEAAYARWVRAGRPRDDTGRPVEVPA